MKRIGIYSGTFNPVHSGHVAFALQAIQIAKLDVLYFLPERRSRYKDAVEHYAHRVAMLKQASRPHRKFKVLESVDLTFSVGHTLPKLISQFSGSQLVFLFGSDIATHIPTWPQADALLATSELVVGVRAPDSLITLQQAIASWSHQPQNVYVIDSHAPEVSSGRVREALAKRKSVRGLLTSVARYSNRHWLYVSLASTDPQP